jgi:hypothetical protein
MIRKENKGYDRQVIEAYRQKIRASGQSFIYDDIDEPSDEYAHFYFIGQHEGREVIYDAMLYTLRLQHESELFEIAEHRAARHFPNFKKITYEEDENGNLETLDDQEEEIGLYMAEVILELEEEDHVKVKEHVDFDQHVDFGIALDIGLHVEEVNPEVIEQFIADFNNDSLKLDTTLYSFQTKAEEV